ncbi:sulfurtransferase complex subunit TusB [Vibrio gangliei]|uniref:sulfurtransferase complex subunit TusB n=1 Tax=Vibrio gangliei TaxID=2077090 RepID=UPI000D015F31|nr:sulfurtransferase complex subunit TusB [Vibrio gangliei]
MLHIIKSQQGLQSAISLSQENDAFLLVEDAVYLAVQAQMDIFTANDLQDRCWVLGEDVEARGVGLSPHWQAQCIDFVGFVGLTEQHVQSMTWL